MAADVTVVLFHDMLYTAGRIVKSGGMHGAMLGQKSPALRERHGMRVHAVDLVDVGAANHNQIVPDADQRLAVDFHVVRQQQVKVLQTRNRPGCSQWESPRRPLCLQ